MLARLLGAARFFRVPVAPLALLASFCAAVALPLPADAASCRASWYGNEHHGRLTASGKRFDQNALTAAHRSLPFGTKVRVSAGPRSVTVTITDRGPAKWTGKCIDLSRGAFRRLAAVAVAVFTTPPLPAVAVAAVAQSGRGKQARQVDQEQQAKVMPGAAVEPTTHHRPLAAEEALTLLEGLEAQAAQVTAGTEWPPLFQEHPIRMPGEAEEFPVMGEQGVAALGVLPELRYQAPRTPAVAAVEHP